MSLKSNRSREKPYTYQPAIPKKIKEDFLRELFDDDVLNNSSDDERYQANRKS